MERKRPLLRLFVGPPARTQWSLITLEIMYLLIVFLPLLGSSVAGFFERFLGSEGSAILTTTCVSFFALVSFSFCLSHFRLKGPLRGILNLFLVFFITIVISLIRIKVMHLLGGQALPLLLEPIIWAAVTGSSGEVVNHQTEASSQWFTYTSDMLEDSDSSGRSSSVNQPIQREQAGPSNAFPAPQPTAAPAAQQQNHLDQPAGEREARAQEHARISAEIERIFSACENEEAAMIRKAHNLLHQLGITLEDAEDVKRALQLALHDDWEHDIDDRQRHFTVLRRNFGTARCERWNSFIEELRGLGNHQVNARHYID
ncbi:unnamed protein product [Eruca vesicaria subsp. sativa]|uniref:Orf314 n=1 Tax=Eruca vesicaria subsp. sativa TaxID=29727 RepID=A0A088BEZ0_ERUVS|nr:orf314 [Eruca vesicaria subsp. sativa]CAH8307708.1 unnamed protein product [Eruca vesicaria subsp. sativa]